MLQKQREDLDRVMEENKVLKSRYENVVEVSVHHIEMIVTIYPVSIQTHVLLLFLVHKMCSTICNWIGETDHLRTFIVLRNVNLKNSQSYN